MTDKLTVEAIDEVVRQAKELPQPISPVRMPCSRCGNDGPWYIIASDRFVSVDGLGDLRDSEFVCGECLINEALRMGKEIAP